MNVINPFCPDDITITSETSGNDIKHILDNKIERDKKTTARTTTVFSGDDVRRFFNEIERCQQNNIKDTEYSDSVKSNFLAQTAFLIIIAVVSLMFIYVSTDDIRGEIPNSKIGQLVAYMVEGLTSDASAVVKEIDNINNAPTEPKEDIPVSPEVEPETP